LVSFGILAAIFLVLAFIFVAQSTEASNPIAKLLNVSHAGFVNGLITFIYIIFILISLTAFSFTMIGIFKSAMAKKDDKIEKQKGVRMAIVSGIILFLILTIWVFSYVYLESKRINVEGPLQDPIESIPEETIQLTAPIEIRFDASGVKPERNYQIISYEWDFGDGDTGTNQIVTHTYKDKGDGRYDVLLTVTQTSKTSDDEIEQVYSRIVTISNQAITANFTATPTEGDAPLEVEFDASSSIDPDGEIDRYEWDLDNDGLFDDEEGATFTHTFENPGKYTVALRVTSTTGEYSVDEKEINSKEATLPNPIIKIVNEPETFVVNQQYIFTADESTSPNGEIEDYEWDFGDGTPVEETKTVSHTFSTEANFEVSLNITDETGKENEVVLTIPVGQPQGTPNASLETQPSVNKGDLSLKGRVPFSVVFDGSKSTDPDNNIVDYEWDFDGDGIPDSYGDQVSNTYTEPGTYTAMLRVHDADGNIGQKSLVIEVESQGMVALLKADKVEGTVPLTVSFDASASTYEDGQIVSYQWDFGDGGRPRIGTSRITYRYKSIGSYTANVTVIGSDNAKATATQLITVREIPLEACFNSVFKKGPAPFETTFDPDCSSGTIADYFWNFGDDETSTSIKPTHTFESPGTYKVTLEITDNDGTVSYSEMDIEVE